jgi:hypothetical protein
MRSSCRQLSVNGDFDKYHTMIIQKKYTYIVSFSVTMFTSTWPHQLAQL